MKRSLRHILFLALLFSQTSVFSCDLCAMYEFGQQRNSSYIGAFYRYRMFNGYLHLGQKHKFNTKIASNAKGLHLSDDFLHDESELDFERYQSYEIRGNIAVNKKLALQVILPYNKATVYFNQVYSAIVPVHDSVFQVSGPGDIRLFANRTWTSEHEAFSCMAQTGVGAKLPTGNFSMLNTDGNPFHQTLQPGSGSWDFLYRLYFQTVYNERFVAYTSLNGSLNSWSRFDPQTYRFGNRVNFDANLSFKITPGFWTIMPKIGVYHERAPKDRNAYGFESGTGGNTTFMNSGIDIVHRKILFNFSWQHPVTDRLFGTQLGNAGRMVAGILYYFE